MSQCFLPSPTNAPLDHFEVECEPIHLRFLDASHGKQQTRLAHDQLGKDVPNSQMDEHQPQVCPTHSR
jgi:hypothetical protein